LFKKFYIFANQTLKPLTIMKKIIFSLTFLCTTALAHSLPNTPIEMVPKPCSSEISIEGQGLNFTSCNNRYFLTVETQSEDQHIEWYRDGVLILEDTRGLFTSECGNYCVRFFCADGTTKEICRVINTRKFEVGQIEATANELCNDCSETTTLSVDVDFCGGAPGRRSLSYVWSLNGVVVGTGNQLTTCEAGTYELTVTFNQFGLFQSCTETRTITIGEKQCSCEFTRPSLTFTGNLFGDGAFDNYLPYFDGVDCVNSPHFLNDNPDIVTNIGWCYHGYISSPVNPKTYSSLSSSFQYDFGKTFNEHTSNGDGSSGAYYGQFQVPNTSVLDPCFTNPTDWDTPAYFAKKINANTNDCFNVCLWAFAFNNDCNLACGNPCPQTSFALYVKSPSGTETIISIKNGVEDAWEPISGEFCVTESGEHLVGLMISREDIVSYDINEISVSNVFFALDDIEIYRALGVGGLNEGELVISPNPNNGTFIVSINDENIDSIASVSINITNNFGHTVYSSSVTGAGPFNINLNGQVPGVYNINVTYNSISLNERVVITGQ
jgi:hypothetical protein